LEEKGMIKTIRSPEGTRQNRTVEPEQTKPIKRKLRTVIATRIASVALLATASVLMSAACSKQVIGEPPIQDSPAREALGNKKVLIVISAYPTYGELDRPTGYWLSEVTHFYHVLARHGIKMDIASPGGKPGVMDPDSNDMDDSLNATFWNNPELKSQLDKPLNPAKLKAEDYGAIYFAGGHGTMWDFTDSPELAKLTARIYENNGIVSAVCHGPAGLINVKLSDGSYLIKDRKVTGFANFEETLVGKTDLVPYLLEDKLKERGGEYSNAFLPFTSYAVTDGRLVTGQNPFSAKEVAEQVIEVLSGKN
tara:strand:- start:57 stop:980 length:924 start_codon:yes stop_codon:yes gene_type:complete